MSLLISSVFTYDEDAGNYIQAVETADAQALEPATRQAINNFVLGCKADGIWNAIKASCILAGARTLAGALVPLVGAAPTNVGGLFVAGDYNRKTGLVGNGSTKYLKANILDSVIPQNSSHLSVYGSSLPDGSSTAPWLGAEQSTLDRATFLYGIVGLGVALNRSSGGGLVGSLRGSSLFVGSSRSSSSSVIIRSGNRDTTVSSTSVTPSSAEYYVFTIGKGNGTVGNRSNARLSFYSIGESLDLALLDTRVTALINAFGASIP